MPRPHRRSRLRAASAHFVVEADLELDRLLRPVVEEDGTAAGLHDLVEGARVAVTSTPGRRG
jgi:hypothetical protein